MTPSDATIPAVIAVVLVVVVTLTIVWCDRAARRQAQMRVVVRPRKLEDRL